jgi:hypothetical protein
MDTTNLRCPECGKGVFVSTLIPKGWVMCRDMGHWVGPASECVQFFEQRPRVTWWACGARFDCLCGAQNVVLTDHQPHTCLRCGRVWDIQFKILCTAPPNHAVHLTPAADALSATDDTEPQA